MCVLRVPLNQKTEQDKITKDKEPKPEIGEDMVLAEGCQLKLGLHTKLSQIYILLVMKIYESGFQSIFF